MSLNAAKHTAPVCPDEVSLRPDLKSTDIKAFPVFERHLNPTRFSVKDSQPAGIFPCHSSFLNGFFPVQNTRLTHRSFTGKHLLLCQHFPGKILVNTRMYPEINMPLLKLHNTRKAHHAIPGRTSRLLYRFWHPHPGNHHTPALFVHICLRGIEVKTVINILIISMKGKLAGLRLKIRRHTDCMVLIASCLLLDIHRRAHKHIAVPHSEDVRTFQRPPESLTPVLGRILPVHTVNAPIKHRPSCLPPVCTAKYHIEGVSLLPYLGVSCILTVPDFHVFYHRHNNLFSAEVVKGKTILC